ncbi:hypothetical protein AXK57_21920 [Tsukamurella pulmonis]|uniref:hypothetical protein n=1 Tax=Tsukamurella pulmonis TaxID=47312 RepID=UPI0007975A08|nr:hypothetical protein [Tsukamurella pulmonis]KXP11601.1 hypothetical protein AXK57_21920 [Tsukamurella pulmonis]
MSNDENTTNPTPGVEHPIFGQNHVDTGVYSEYGTEPEVDPRGQKLRAAPAPEDTDPEGDGEFVGYDLEGEDDDAARARDPYGIGEAALAGNSVRVADHNAIEQSRGGLDGRSKIERNRERYDSASTVHDPATWGRRGWLNRTFGMKRPPLPGEVAYRRDVETIKLPINGTPVVTFAQKKGGENKTGYSRGFSATVGKFRGSGVVNWDISSTNGTLAMRAHNANPDGRSVWDLLAHAKPLLSKDSVATAIDNFLIPQPTLDEVLAADDTGRHNEQLVFSSCQAAFAVLRRHKRFIVCDTDNDHLAESWQWAMEHADQIVIPMTYRDDTIQQTETMLRHAVQNPKIGPKKVSEAIVLLAPLPTAPATAEQREAIEDTLSEFSITEIIDAPYDPVFDGQRGRIVYEELSHDTQCMLADLAATVISRMVARVTPNGEQMPLDLAADDAPAAFTGEIPTGARLRYAEQPQPMAPGYPPVGYGQGPQRMPAPVPITNGYSAGYNAAPPAPAGMAFTNNDDAWAAGAHRR